MAARSGAVGIPRHERLRLRQDFQDVFQGGRRIQRPSLVLLWRARAGGRQVGFAVSRQVEGAVGRNRARRRLREAYRIHRQLAPEGVQVICVARPMALRGPFRLLSQDVEAALSALRRQLEPGGD